MLRPLYPQERSVGWLTHRTGHRGRRHSLSCTLSRTDKSLAQPELEPRLFLKTYSNLIDSKIW